MMSEHLKNTVKTDKNLRCCKAEQARLVIVLNEKIIFKTEMRDSNSLQFILGGKNHEKCFDNYTLSV